MNSVIEQKQKMLSEIYIGISLFYREIKSKLEDKLENGLAKERKEEIVKEKLKDEIKGYNSNIKKIPKMLRKNGLVLTLSFLNKKAAKEKTYENILVNYVNYIKSNFSFEEKLENEKIEKIIEYFLKNSSNLKTQELKKLTMLTIKFFDAYSILADGYGSDLE